MNVKDALLPGTLMFLQLVLFDFLDWPPLVKIVELLDLFVLTEVVALSDGQSDDTDELEAIVA